MRNVHHIISLFLLVSVLIGGCNGVLRPALDCSQLFDSRLTRAPLLSKTSGEFSRWIRDNYHSDDLYGVGEGPDYYWKVDKRQYIAYTAPGRVPKIVADLSPTPMVRELITCLGTPEAYEAAVLNPPEGQGVYYSVWYPSKGVIFSYEEYRILGLGLPHTLNTSSQFNKIEVFPAMDKQTFIDQEVKRLSPGLAARVHDWPQQFDVISIEH